MSSDNSAADTSNTTSTAVPAADDSHFENWRAKLINWSKSIEADHGNKNPLHFAKATDPLVSSLETRIAQLTASPEALVLGVGDDGKIIPLHSFTNAEGTIVNPSNKIIALSGISHDAKAVIVDVATAFGDHIKARAPKIADIAACNSIEEVEALENLRSDAGCAHLSGLCIPPPYLVEDILLLMNNSLEEELAVAEVDPSKVLDLVLTKAREFEAEHQNDVTYQGTGVESVAHLVRYLLSVKRGFVPKTVLQIDANDEGLQIYQRSQHQKYILPPLDDTNRIRRLEERLDVFQSQSTQVNFALGKISEVLQTSNELSSKRIEISESKMEKEKDRTSKYHPSVINALTILASVDGFEAAEAPADSVLRILNCASHSKAELEIISQFKAMRLNVTFSQGTSKAIYDGKFTWSSPESPTCVSPFTIELSKPNGNSIHDRHMILSTLETHGKSMTPAEAEKSLKQSLTVPESFHELMDQGRVYVALLKILGGDDNDVAHKVEELFKSLDLNRTKVEALIARNVETGGHILYQVGLKVNNYLEYSHTVASPSEIPRSTLNFSSLREAIDSFTMIPILPTTFKQLVNEPANTDAEPKPGRKKKRNGNGAEGGKRKLVRNPEPVEEWQLKDGEKWEWFSGENCKDRPTWNGKCKMCHKFHMKDICFDDCPNGESHVPGSKVPADKKKAFSAWRAGKIPSS